MTHRPSQSRPPRSSTRNRRQKSPIQRQLDNGRPDLAANRLERELMNLGSGPVEQRLARRLGAEVERVLRAVTACDRSRRHVNQIETIAGIAVERDLLSTHVRRTLGRELRFHGIHVIPAPLSRHKGRSKEALAA